MPCSNHLLDYVVEGFLCLICLPQLVMPSPMFFSRSPDGLEQNQVLHLKEVGEVDAGALQYEPEISHQVGITLAISVFNILKTKLKLCLG